MGFNLFFKNAVLFSSFLIEALRFNSFIKKAEKVQLDLLLENIRRNQESNFGKEHNFAAITNIQKYRAEVPVRNYDEFLPWLNQMQSGRCNVLTTDKINLFEPTGGSSGGVKLIPYSENLSDAFQRGIAVWLFDLYRNYPKLLNLKSYWLITPRTNLQQKTEGDIPIGFLEDSQYLGKIAPWVSDIFVNFQIPNSHLTGDKYHYTVIRFLLETKNLGLISVWHPSMLRIFMECFEKFSVKVIEDINQGTLSCTESEIRLTIGKGNKKRGKEIQKYLGDNLFWQKVWPELQVISCWGDAAAEQEAQKLKIIFPQVYLQYKGLLATECMMTIPLRKAQGNVPAIRSHFFEFEEVGSKNYFSISQLKQGEKYKLILTNFGGLYRYDIGDIVEVMGHWKGLPLLKFVGRDRFSDLVGEKLSEMQVEVIIQGLKKEYPFSFLLLAPGKTNEQIHYTLFVESEKEIGVIKELGVRFENELCVNYYYQQAILTGQLRKLRVFYIIENGQEKYLARKTSDGQRLGDIKPRFLDNTAHWENHFAGHYIV